MQSAPIGRSGHAALGLAALFSGIALLGTILFDLPLPLGLGATATVGVAIVALIWRELPARRRRELRQLLRVGVVAGAGATAAYDVTRLGLAAADPSSFNPFEALRVFGVLLTGSEGPLGLAAGVGYHALNGTAFGVAWLLVFGQRAVRGARQAVVLGVAWGLALETFQLALYPGWLSINLLAEFTVVSLAGHVAYGTTLGLIGRRLLTAPSRAASPEVIL